VPSIHDTGAGIGVRSAADSMRCVAIVCFLACATGCPTVDLGEDLASPGVCRPDRAYFDTVIWPQYLAPADEEASCVGQSGCHRLEDGRSAFRLDVPASDPPSSAELNRNYATVTAFLNCGVPEASRLLTEPISGIESHGGGDLFDPGSEPEAVFLGWFTP
jgi:hypothetical protein